MPKGDVTGPLGAKCGCKTGGGYGCCDRICVAEGAPATHEPPGPDNILGPDEEVALLKSESERLKSVLETIEQRIRELEGL
ncbi:MAG: DUF5320 domain-containing protein [Actinobacteria bacterium]|nr:DUF5320 domain-containing protein [Actinomycetota bacterium]